MKYQSFWFRAIIESADGRSAHVFVAGNMEEAREYTSNMARRTGSAVLKLEVISREEANEAA